MNYCTDLEKMELLYNTVLCQLFFNSTECDQMFLYTKRIRDTEEKFLQDEVKETTWADLYREIAKLTGMPYDEEAEKPEKLKPKHMIFCCGRLFRQKQENKSQQSLLPSPRSSNTHWLNFPISTTALNTEKWFCFLQAYLSKTEENKSMM